MTNLPIEKQGKKVITGHTVANPLPTDVEHYEPPVGMECRRIKTGAEKVFDSAVYGGIGWIGNATLSTALAYFMKYSKAGKPLFDKAVKTIAATINPKNPNIAAVNKNAEVAALIVGGTALMWPVKLLEDNKAKVVRTIDRAITNVKSLVGIRETLEEHQEKEAAFELLAQEPKQNWWTILRARAVGLGAVFAALNAVGPRINNKIEDTVANAVTKTFKNGDSTHHFNSEKVHKIAKLATLDVLYSMVAAAGLYVDSHFINRPKKNESVLQEGGFNPLNPPNEEPIWIGHARRLKRPSPTKQLSNSFTERLERTSQGQSLVK